MRADDRFSPERGAAAYEDFLRRFPAYAKTAAVDDLRGTDYARLDRLGHTYLDYTGGGLYAESQLRRHHELLSGRVLGNPHSQSPTSLASAALASEARDAVRRFFHAPEDEFEIVFTANASGALKLVGEAYPFAPGGVFLLSYDNHNSVNGIREFAARGGAAVSYIPVREEDLRLDEEQVHAGLRGAGDGAAKLFAYPAQSNFSGVQHPLEWVAEARELGWDVVLDCAAYAPTNPVDAHAIGADFIPISFYKLFGYPTGSGCLIARREALAKLRRPWFAGGTITLASVQEEEWYHLAPGATGFEDGTIDYLGLPAVTIGLEHVEAVGMEVDPRARLCLGLLAAPGAAGAAAQRRLTAGARVRTGGRGVPRGDHRAVPGGSGGAALRRLRRRGGRRPGAHLRAQRLLLQPRRRRDRAPHHARRRRELLQRPERGDHPARVPAAHRGRHRQGAQHHPRVARPRLRLQGCVSVRGVRREIPGQACARRRVDILKNRVTLSSSHFTKERY